MISYIVIGRNEGFKLEKCFKSIEKSIKENAYLESEVIYVDSKSDDNSLAIAQKFSFVKVYKLNADYNAPIARNLGATKANGDIFFFIDGDMEIESSFLKNIINQNSELSYGFVGGYYINKYYDKDWSYLSSSQYPPKRKLKFDYLEASTGGLFVISRKYWEMAGGMKNYLYGGADPDLAYRLHKKGILKLRKTELMGIHHTITPEYRMEMKDIFKKRYLRGRILLYRENLLCPAAFKKMVRYEYTSFFLLILIILSFLFNHLFVLIALAVYMLGIIFKTRKRGGIMRNFTILLAKDVVFLFGLIFYWPNKKVKVKFDSL